MTTTAYPPIADYALLSDLSSVALVSRSASIDWLCMPRADRGSQFGRLLDWERGGHLGIEVAEADFESFRAYEADSLVVRTTFVTEGGRAAVHDFLAVDPERLRSPRHLLVRVIEGLRGKVDLRLAVSPRFDYGGVAPWFRRHSEKAFAAIGGDDGLVVSCDEPLYLEGLHDVVGNVSVRAQQKVRLCLRFVAPEDLDTAPPAPPGPQEVDEMLEKTLAFWRDWAALGTFGGPDAPAVRRSATVLKGLCNARTGAILAAASTSLPERAGGDRNWDYRLSWVRDSSFSVRSLADIGHDQEADSFRRFIERSAAGNATHLQTCFGPGGERRLNEVELPMSGYRDSRPVRAGNLAAGQLQLDVYGEMFLLSYGWHRRGSSPDDDYWRFLVNIADTVAGRWREPDHGLWEVRRHPRHFVHSKVMCWSALEHALRLAEECLRKAPVRRWEKERDAIRKAVLSDGVDRGRGTFVQAFGSRNLDASLLLLPRAGFCDYRDPTFVKTVDAILEELSDGGLIRRFVPEETGGGMEGDEGAFVACSFWMVECLARLDRLEEARELFDRASATSNDLGLFAEEYDPRQGLMLGNFPQGLSHYSHILAAQALAAALPATG